jgi:hypothetical protein
MNEETMPYANVKSGVMDIADSAVRDQINQLLSRVTSETTVTPYITLEKISKTLANFHISLPAQTFFEGDSGNAIWPVSQFGNKFGENDDGQVVTTPPSQYSIYFEYRMADSGMFNVFCELVDQDELDEILDDLEAELNDDTEEEEEDEVNEGLDNVVLDTKTGNLSKKGPGGPDLSKVVRNLDSGKISLAKKTA